MDISRSSRQQSDQRVTRAQAERRSHNEPFSFKNWSKYDKTIVQNYRNFLAGHITKLMPDAAEKGPGLLERYERELALEQNTSQENFTSEITDTSHNSRSSRPQQGQLRPRQG